MFARVQAIPLDMLQFRITLYSFCEQTKYEKATISSKKPKNSYVNLPAIIKRITNVNNAAEGNQYFTFILSFIEVEQSVLYFLN